MILIFSVCETLVAQVATPAISASVSIYECMKNGTRGASLSNAGGTIYFNQRKGSSYYSAFSLFLPAKEKIIINLEIFDKSQTIKFPIERLNIATPNPVQAINQNEFVFTRNQSEKNTITLNFWVSGISYSIDLNLAWRKEDIQVMGIPSYEKTDRPSIVGSETPSVYLGPGWAVQVGSSKNKFDRDAESAKLKLFGDEVYVLKEGGWYKLRVGLYDQETAAHQALKQIVQLETFQRNQPKTVYQERIMQTFIEPLYGPRYAEFTPKGYDVDESKSAVPASYGHDRSNQLFIQVRASTQQPKQEDFRSIKNWQLLVVETPEFYKIWVGPFSDIQSAEAGLEKLRNSGYPDAFTVTVPTEAALEPVTYSDTQAQVIPRDISSGYHLVQKGQTLFSIARLYGFSVAELRQWNNLSEGNAIYTGQQLKIKP